MKRLQILTMAAFLVLGISSWAGAAPAPLDDTLEIDNTPARVLVYDNFGMSGDNNVNLTLKKYYYGSDTLEYSYDNGASWNIISWPKKGTFTIPISTGDAHKQLIEFRVLEGTTEYYNATLTFLGSDTPAGSDQPLLWNSVALDFYKAGSDDPFYSFTATPGRGDHVAPTPIPSAAWLIGTGFVGLVYRRRRKKSSC